MWLSVCMSGVCVWTNMSVLYSIKSVVNWLSITPKIWVSKTTLWNQTIFCQLTQTVFGGQLTYFHWNIGVSRLWLSWPPKVGHQKFHACEMSGLDLRVGTQWLERTSEGRDRHLEMSPGRMVSVKNWQIYIPSGYLTSKWVGSGRWSVCGKWAIYCRFCCPGNTANLACILSHVPLKQQQHFPSTSDKCGFYTPGEKNEPVQWRFPSLKWRFSTWKWNVFSITSPDFDISISKHGSIDPSWPFRLPHCQQVEAGDHSTASHSRLLETDQYSRFFSVRESLSAFPQ